MEYNRGMKLRSTRGQPGSLGTTAAPPVSARPNGLVAAWARGLLQLKVALAATVGRLTLFQQFALLSLVILVVGAYVIGNYVSGEIKGRVIHRTSAIASLYMDSFVSPHVQELDTEQSIPPDQFDQLDGLLSGTPLGQKIVAFKIWNNSGRIVYANNDRRLIGREFTGLPDLKEALAGAVVAEIDDLQDEENEFERPLWDHLLEVYSPVRKQETGEIIGVAEFYQDPSDLEAEINASQRKGWLIVGGATGVMYLLLVGLVRGASTTISRQHSRLERLAKQNSDLAERVRRAAAQKSETDEQLRMRIAQDLHDGPAQDVSLALLRLESAGRTGGAGPQPMQSDDQLVHAALTSALQEIRLISAGLQLPELKDLPLQAVVEKAIQEHQNKTGNRVTLTAVTGLPPVGLPFKIAIYRITQEALNNAYAHAGVSEQEIDLSYADGAVRLEVRDHGVGLEGSTAPSRSGKERTHLGLRGMQERAEMLGGTLEIISGRGQGTTVRAVVPVS